MSCWKTKKCPSCLSEIVYTYQIKYFSDKYTYCSSVEISSALAKKQLETVGEVRSHLSKFSVECRDAADRDGWGIVFLLCSLCSFDLLFSVISWTWIVLQVLIIVWELIIFLLNRKRGATLLGYNARGGYLSRIFLALPS